MVRGPRYYCKILERGINMCKDCGKTPCECKPYPAKTYREHDTVTSRITGDKVEIQPAYTGGGFVFRNPFASLAQARFAHANPEKFGGENALEQEWDKNTDFKNLPERKGKKGKKK